jgi:hypothetical protein
VVEAEAQAEPRPGLAWFGHGMDGAKIASFTVQIKKAQSNAK